MKNIYLLLSQNNKSKLAAYCYDESKNIKVGELGLQINNTVGWTNCWSERELYITSEEHIKEGDWYYNHKTNTVQKRTNGTNNEFYIGFKKVILATDQKLTDGNVQPISEEFLQWFVKNSNCEFVETEKLEDGRYVNFLPNGDTEEGVYENYKIIVPKEEWLSPMRPFKLKEETLEEAGERIAKEIDYQEFDLASFKLGIKWQQERSYSEEEVLFLINKLCYDLGEDDSKGFEWFQQFKKK